MTYIDDAKNSGIKLVHAIDIDKKIPDFNKDKARSYVSFMHSKGLVDRTITKNLYCFSIYLKAIGKKNVMEVTKEDVEKAVATIEQSDYSAKSKQNIKVSIKQFYKHFSGDDETYPREISWIKTSLKDNKHLLPEDILTEEEIEKMLEAAPNIRDKAIIALLFDTGIRIGELMTIRIKDVDLTTSPAHVVVNGKTGMRKIPLYFSVPHLAAFLNTIKSKSRTDSLWFGLGSHIALRKVDYGAVRMMLKRTGEAAKIKKRIYPHLFRHSRASYYANKLTEQQLKAYFGWTGGSRMAATYVHLSGRDIDNAIMQANGEQPADAITKPKLTIKVCGRCQLANTTESIFCTRCGNPLDADLGAKMVSQDDKLKEAISDSLSDPEVVKMLLPVLKGILKEKKGKK